MPRRQRQRRRPRSRLASIAGPIAGGAQCWRSAIMLLDLGDRLGGIQVLRAGLGAVHDRVAAIQPERILEVVEPRAGGLVAACPRSSDRRQQRGRAEVAVAVPPVARAARRAAGAQDALVRPVELLLVLLGLQPLAVGRRGRARLQPGLDRRVLGVEVGEVRHQVLDHRHVRQRVDLHLALDVVDGLGAGQRVDAVDVHRAGAADALAAGAAEGQRRIDLVLDLDQRVENHRPALGRGRPRRCRCAGSRRVSGSQR